MSQAAVGSSFGPRAIHRNRTLCRTPFRPVPKQARFAAEQRLLSLNPEFRF
jgi:hypothetical protein